MVKQETLFNLPFRIGDVTCKLNAVLPFHQLPEIDKNYYEHTHHYFEVHAVKQGRETVICNNKLIEIEGPKLLLLPPNMYHKVQNFSDNCVEMCLSFGLKAESKHSDQDSQFFYKTFITKQQPLLLELTQTLESTLHKICGLAKAEKPTFIQQERLRIACTSFLLELFEAMAEHRLQEPDDRKAPISSPEYIIDNFFALNYMDGSAKEKLARALHVSPRQLHRILMDYYGKNYREKLNEIRLQVATGLLLDSEMSIAEISERVGYSTPENFATFIRNETGKTPGQIRKEGLPPSINKKNKGT